MPKAKATETKEKEIIEKSLVRKQKKKKATGKNAGTAKGDTDTGHALAEIIETMDKKGVGGSHAELKDIVRRHLTVLMNKNGNDAARISAAKALTDIINKQQENGSNEDSGSEAVEREAAIAECSRLLADLATRLATRPSRNIALA